MVTLSNKYITAKISENGAELQSLIHNGFEYIWQADPKYWGRHAPILFPIVGKVYNNEYRVDGRTYSLPQHGFARDREFQLIQATDTKATFLLQSNDETLNVYPYKFELIVNYHLSYNRLIVTYTVRNTDDKEIYFQIGGHPAFNLPTNKSYLRITNNGKAVTEINVKYPNKEGYILNDIHPISLHDGIMPIQETTFDNGALILEDNQCDSILMLDENKTPHLTLHSKANLFGIWSPERKNAPFVCIEPWMGRADDEKYNGEFKNRPFVNRLSQNEEMNFEYQISINVRHYTKLQQLVNAL